VNSLPTLWLASRSPRRISLLEQAGVAVSVRAPDIDDGRLRHGEVPPEWWVMSLAYLKARRVADALRVEASRLTSADRALVLGADTVCAVGRSVLGQPRDAADARRMLRLMREREHRTLTGVCLLPLNRSDWRLIVFDAAIVRLGELSDHQIETYLASEEWRGKAGAYNLSERIAAGWPISCIGDPTTVMGLPMQRLQEWLGRAMRP
jgi:septum formation protein